MLLAVSFPLTTATAVIAAMSIAITATIPPTAALPTVVLGQRGLLTAGTAINAVATPPSSSSLISFEDDSWRTKVMDLLRAQGLAEDSLKPRKHLNGTMVADRLSAA
jgi:hypothetical protein